MSETREGDRAQGFRPSSPATGRTGWLGQRARFILLAGVAAVGPVLTATLVV